MKNIDRLLSKAQKIKKSWGVWPCMVYYSELLGKLCVYLVARNKRTGAKISENKQYVSAEAAIEGCGEFIEKYGVETEPVTIVVNDLPGGEEDEAGENTIETVEPNGS